jgi:hypothetical protein
MDLKTLDNTPPWEWPEGTDQFLLDVLRDTRTNIEDRLLAADLAGDYVVINDELATALLAIACNAAENEELRCEAVLSLGLALENSDILGFDDDDEEDEPLISRAVFDKIQTELHKLFMDTSTPDEVRRRTLEASSHAPQPWHTEAVRAAYASENPEWRLSAVFCMRTVEGFETQIVDSLRSPNPDMHYQAVCAAGQWGIDDAWKHVVALVQNNATEKALLLAAIEAVGAIRPHEALGVLEKWMASDDEEISETVQEVLLASGAMSDLEADTYEDDDEEE